jgi:hypothetical protein
VVNGQTVTLSRPTQTGTDRYNDPVWTWTDTDIAGCAWVPRETSEATQGAEEVTFDAECYLPPGTAVSPLDRITRNGETFEVFGHVSDWISPFTQVRAPVRVRVRRVQGVSAHSVSAGGA